MTSDAGMRSSAGTALVRRLAVSPVVPAVEGAEAIEAFLAHERAGVCTLAGPTVTELPAVLERFRERGAEPIVNLDSIAGISRDRAGLEHLHSLGATGVLSSRLAVLQFAREQAMLTVQALFVAGLASLPANAAAIRSARPHLVQLAPAPVLDRMTPAERADLGRFVASGFVRTPEHVRAALAGGAVGVLTTRPELWSLTRDDVATVSADGRSA